MMNSLNIYQQYGQELYLFILRKVRDRHAAHDIFQTIFLKIHKNIHQLKDEGKARAWVFQISRNEISNYFNESNAYTDEEASIIKDSSDPCVDVCCFDRFIDELPATYQDVIQLTYLSGKNQEEVATMLDLSLANVKARIRRGKALLKERFLECCQFEINPEGKLVGAPNCTTCH